MTQSQRIANTEVLIVLKKLNMIDKIPKDVVLAIQNNQDESWNFVYDDTVPLDKQKLTRQSIIMFSNLYCTYICKDESEKQKIKTILQENEKKKNEETLNKLNNLNRREEKTTNVIEKNEESFLIETENHSIIKKLIDKIKSLFSKEK